MSAEADREPPPREPFLLSVLPFAGLVGLLLLALAWKLVGRGGEAPADLDPGEMVVDRWERAALEEIEISPADFTLGPEDAPVTLVEFSDFECPYCRAGAGAVKELFAEFPGQVRLVFKNLPLDTSCNEDMAQQLHPFACRAAVFARCAGEGDRDRFWQAHDALFQAPRLTEELFSSLSSELSLPLDELDACIASPEPLARVKEDLAVARKLGVSSTPTFFLNGRQVSDYRDGALGRIVRRALSESGGS